MKDRVLQPRDFLIIDTFEKHPWQPAFDFCNEVKNRVGKTGKLLRENLQNINLVEKPSVVIIDQETIEECYKAITRFLSESSDKSLIICTHRSLDSLEVNKLIPSGFKKSKVTVLSTKEVVILKEKSDIDKIKLPVRTRSVLT